MAGERGEIKSSHSYLHFSVCFMTGHGQAVGEGLGCRTWDSAKSGEMAVPNSAAEVTDTIAYTLKQDSEALDKRDVNSPVFFQDPFLFHVRFKFKKHLI